MQTFSICTLGCKVNQYESEQIATLLRGLGLTQVDTGTSADLRIVNSCSVTVQAASKSRQALRRAIRLPVLQSAPPAEKADYGKPTATRVVATGCWATSNKSEASSMVGVDAVLGHHDDVSAELTRLITTWRQTQSPSNIIDRPAKLHGDNGRIKKDGTSPGTFDDHSRPESLNSVKNNVAPGTTLLPMLGERQTGQQRAFLKIQDGCDAHCTYCIIPSLRPALWSKPVEAAVEEAKRLVDAGHVELILTGIFMGAYGQATALRRRQPNDEIRPLANLVDALCTRVPGLQRLRLSSLEPGDLTDDLIGRLAAHKQVVPHFHLPLQSGSDKLLRRMNRQYTRSDFLHMIDRVRDRFDRPAITTDIIVGFPGETDQEFEQTVDAAQKSGFLHIHAFSFTPRPGTAAARWTVDFVHGPVVNQRIEHLNQLARDYSYDYRRQFLGQTVEILVERQGDSDALEGTFQNLQHGRSERYFAVHFESERIRTGELVRLVIERVTPHRTFGALVGDCA